jgi:hypothetical protein
MKNHENLKYPANRLHGACEKYIIKPGENGGALRREQRGSAACVPRADRRCDGKTEFILQGEITHG